MSDSDSRHDREGDSRRTLRCLLPWLIAGSLGFGCASTNTGEVARELTQCRDAFEVTITLELSADDELQIRSSHPCPETVFPLDRRGSVRIFAPDREATAWLSLASREALSRTGRPPLWVRNTMSVWVQATNTDRPQVTPVERPGDFLLFATRQPGGGPKLTLVSSAGAIVADEPLQAGLVAKAGRYTLAILLDVVTLPFAPFIILFGAMGS